MKISPNKQVRSTVLLITVLLLLLILAIQPASDSYHLSDTIKRCLGFEVDGSIFRRILHIPAYFILGLALIWFGHNHRIKRWIPQVFGISIGIAEELLKGCIPTRDCDLLDIVMDIIGIILALFFCFFYHMGKEVNTQGKSLKQQKKELLFLWQVFHQLQETQSSNQTIQ